MSTIVLFDSSEVPKWQTITDAPMPSAMRAAAAASFTAAPTLLLVRGGVLDGRAVGGDYFDALLSALSDYVGGLLAVAEVEVLGRADPAHLNPGDPGGPNGRYLACAQGSFLGEKGPGGGAQSPRDLVGGVR